MGQPSNGGEEHRHHSGSSLNIIDTPIDPIVTGRKGFIRKGWERFVWRFWTNSIHQQSNTTTISNIERRLHTTSQPKEYQTYLHNLQHQFNKHTTHPKCPPSTDSQPPLSAPSSRAAPFSLRSRSAPSLPTVTSSVVFREASPLPGLTVTTCTLPSVPPRHFSPSCDLFAQRQPDPEEEYDERRIEANRTPKIQESRHNHRHRRPGRRRLHALQQGRGEEGYQPAQC